ncbi:MAG: outer membrane protein assembly factor BamB [Candidatus Promineifilaceae bacterium]|jgi:outer membrane protein assembly factor BamB
MMVKSIVFGVCCLGALAGPVLADWTHYQGPTYDGISAEKGLGCTALKTVWEASVNIGFSGISVADGRVFTMGNKDDQDAVYALSEATGEVLWTYTYPQKRDPNLYEGGPNTTPTVDGTRLYTMSRSGLILCLDAASGDLLWKASAEDVGAKAPSWGFSGAPTIVGDSVLLNVGSAGLALDKTTGKKVWDSKAGPAGYGPIIPYKQKGKALGMLVSGTDVVSLDLASGEKRWSLPFKVDYNVNAAAPLIFGSRVFISGGYGKGGGVYDFSSGKGKELWFSRDLKTQFSTAIILNGYVYGVDGNTSQRAKMVCLDLKDGALKWKSPCEFGSVRYADGKFFFLNQKGDLIISTISPEGMKEVKRKHLFDDKCWTAPTIANGKLFARSAHGSMLCIDLK